jgi:hypothetical protein
VRDPHVSGGPGTDDPGRITYSYISMDSLLIRALGVKENQIIGARWRGSEHHDTVEQLFEKFGGEGVVELRLLPRSPTTGGHDFPVDHLDWG